MNATWKTIRVFISSTFRDMQAERDHLVRFVFPRLRQELLQRRIHLVDVDLRWGVTSEQDALSVCREVVDECRPRFLCMLGGRYGWIPPRKTRSITADEVHYGVLDRDLGSRGFAYFYFRDPSTTAAMVEVTPEEFREPAGSHGAAALAELKTAIIEAGLQPFIYRAQWDDHSRRLIGLKEFGDRVHADLLAGMKSDPELQDRFTTDATAPLNEFAEENAAMEAFIEERVQRFVLGSRRPVWEELLQHAEGAGGNGYLCLTGEAGSGKSALLGKFCRDYRDAHPQDLVIAHFVGASPGSTDVRRTLRRLCRELAEGAGVMAEMQIAEVAGLTVEIQIPEDPEKLRVAFAEILQQASAKKRVVILLDAVNQFDSAGQLAGGSWLPEELPATARIILSTLSGPALESLRQRRQPPRLVELQPLDAQDREAIIREFLHRYQKAMTPDQRVALLAKADAGTPLYLLVALEELRTLGTYEEITERIAQLPPDTRALFIWILKRLEDDDGFRDASGRKTGRELVSRFVSLMGASRHGLSRRELVELLSPGDPQGNVAALTQLLRPYLIERGELLDFYHGQFREAVGQAHLTGVAESCKSHIELADYFTACAKGTDPQKGWETNSVRGFSECVFHRVKAGQHEQAEGLLTNFPFLLHKLRVGLLEGVLEDYDMVRREAPAEVARRLEMWADFFREKAHILRRGNEGWPGYKILLQVAVEHADESPLTIAAERWLADGRCDWLWLRRNRRLARIQKDPCLAVLEGHTGAIWDALVLADGRVLSWSNDKTLRLWDGKSGACLKVLEGHTGSVYGAMVLTDGQLLSWSGDNTLRLWDTNSGACLRVLEGSTPYVSDVMVFVCGAMVLADGRLLSWSSDGTLRLWNVKSGKCLKVLKGHAGSVFKVEELADGRLLSRSYGETVRVWDGRNGKCIVVIEEDSDNLRVLADGRLLSWSKDGTLRLWDVKSGACLAVLKGHTSGVSGVLVLTDGRLLSWSSDGTLRLWNVKSGKCLKVLKGHASSVFKVEELADGRLLSWSKDGTLRLWDVKSGACLAVLKGHTSGVSGVHVLTDGRLLSWSDDKTLRMWDSQNGACLAVLEGHTSGISGVRVVADGRLLSWSSDNALRLWDGKSGACLAVLEGHTSWIAGVRVLANGRLLSWSKDSTLGLWDLKSGACLAMLEGHTEEFHDVEELANGRLLSWSDDRTLRLLDGKSGACLAVLAGHTGEVHRPVALADGRLLTWAKADSTLRVWDGNCDTRAADSEEQTDNIIEGTLRLPDGRLLSWSTDKLLRLWDSHSGACLAELKGHTSSIFGAWALPDGRFVSWSADKTLRLWNGRSGKCLAVLEGHTEGVSGAMALGDGRLLSWSGFAAQLPAKPTREEIIGDKTLRLWDGKSGKCLAVLEGHTQGVMGVLALSNGHILSWAGFPDWAAERFESRMPSPIDKTLRLWDAQHGKCLAVLEGHTEGVTGAIELADGRLLSWARGDRGADRAFRLWDGHTGVRLDVIDCLDMFAAQHYSSIRSVLELADGRVLVTVTGVKRLEVWDINRGARLDWVKEDELAGRHPEWLHAREEAQNPGNVVGDLVAVASDRTAHLRHRATPSVLASWNTDAGLRASCLLPDGTAVVLQNSRQVCFLKLYYGQRRVSLAEMEKLLLPHIRQGSAALPPAQETTTKKVKKKWWKFW